MILEPHLLLLPESLFQELLLLIYDVVLLLLLQLVLEDLEVVLDGNQLRPLLVYHDARTVLAGPGKLRFLKLTKQSVPEHTRLWFLDNIRQRDDLREVRTEGLTHIHNAFSYSSLLSCPPKCI